MSYHVFYLELDRRVCVAFDRKNAIILFLFNSRTRHNVFYLHFDINMHDILFIMLNNTSLILNLNIRNKTKKI